MTRISIALLAALLAGCGPKPMVLDCPPSNGVSDDAKAFDPSFTLKECPHLIPYGPSQWPDPHCPPGVPIIYDQPSGQPMCELQNYGPVPEELRRDADTFGQWMQRDSRHQ